MDQKELTAKVDRLTGVVEKVHAEIVVLKQLVENGPVNPELAASVERLEAALTAADDENPDAPQA